MLKKRFVDHEEESIAKRRLVQHDSDVMWRAAVLSWLAPVGVVEQLTAILPPQTMLVLNKLSKTACRWMYIEKAIVNTHIIQYITGDSVPMVKRLNKHWSRALMRCQELPGVVLLVDKALSDFADFKRSNSGKRNQIANFFELNRTRFEQASHWIIRKSSVKSWMELIHAVDQSLALRDKVVSCTVHFQQPTTHHVAMMVHRMKSLKHLTLYPANPMFFNFTRFSYMLTCRQHLHSLTVIPAKISNYSMTPLKITDLLSMTNLTFLRVLVLGNYEVDAASLKQLLDMAPQLSHLKVAGVVGGVGLNPPERPMWLTVFKTGGFANKYDELTVKDLKRGDERNEVSTRRNAWDFVTVVAKIG